MKLVNTAVAIGALAAAALAPLSASALVSAETPLGVAAQPTTQTQQEAKLKLFWETEQDFCLLIVAVCIEPDDSEG